MRVLLVEFPGPRRDQLRDVLWREGADVLVASPDMPEANRQGPPPDVIVVSPDAGGPGVARGAGPVIEAAETSEVVAQLRALFPVPCPVHLPNAQLDLSRGVAHRDGREVPLTETEGQLLRYLWVHRDRAVPEPELSRKVWGHRERVRSRAVVNTIYRLRRKIETDPASPQGLRSVDRGYRLVVRSGAPSAVRSNLRPVRDSFVGRDRERAEVVEALATRLVTVTGPSGVGKSRLAHEIALAEQRVYEGGAWCIDLADARSPSDVLHSVVSGLELPMGSTLREALRDRGATLLWFDEIEAVAEALAEEVSVLLDACPELVVLVTHLQPLGLRGERVYRLAPLPPAGGDDVDTVLASTAARLFEERATEHDPGFSLTADNAQSVAAITRALDGLPLGLELAASLVGSLPLEGLLRGLESSLDLLRASETDRPRRHRGLRAALDASWDRLSPAERARLPQLTVFVGSFTLDAAQAVLRPMQPVDVAQLLHQLTRKSMIRYDDVIGRHSMLASIRRFVSERLEPAEAEALADRHAAYYAQAEILLPDLSNALAACRHSLAHRRSPLALDLFVAVSTLVQRAGNPRIVLDLAREALGRLVEPALRARVHAALSRAADLVGEVDLAEVHAKAAVSEAHEGADPVAIAHAHAALAHYLLQDRDIAEADRQYDHAIRWFGSIGDERWLAISLRNRAMALRGLGRQAEGRALLERASALFERVGDRRGLAMVWLDLGLWDLGSGKRDRARYRYEQALALSQADGHLHLEAVARRRLGNLALDLGELEQAEQQILAGLRAVEELGVWRGRLYGQCDLGELFLMRGDHDRSLEVFDDVLATSRHLGDLSIEGYALGRLVTLHERRGRPAVADLLARAGEHVRSVAPWSYALLRATHAGVLAERGQISAAWDALAEAEQVARASNLEPEHPYGRSLAEARALVERCASSGPR